jgi:sortase A
MLGYVAWQEVGTDVVAGRVQRELRQDIRERWQHPTVIDLVGPETSPPLGRADSLIRVPRFGTEYEMPIVEGVRDEDLGRGVGHFPGAGPGQIGNFALAAHRVTNGEPFQDFPRLRPGDTVIIETSDAIHTYVLDTNPNDLVVSFAEAWVLDPAPVAPKGEAPPGMPTFDVQTPHGTPDSDPQPPTEAVITLSTSSELFKTERMIAFGHLVSTSPK